MKLNQEVKAGNTVTLEDKKVGILTSSIQITKAGGEGLKVTIGEAIGELIAVPFLSHEYYKP